MVEKAATGVRQYAHGAGLSGAGVGLLEWNFVAGSRSKDDNRGLPLQLFSKLLSGLVSGDDGCHGWEWLKHEQSGFELRASPLWLSNENPPYLNQLP